MSDAQGLKAGDNPIADAMAKRHVELLMKTGMAYEFSPETIATRAFLDGFAAICGVLDEVKAGRDAVEAELKITKEERDNYAHWLNESAQANYTNIQKVLELELELNYAAHCVTRVEELSKKLLALRRELERVSKRGQNRDAENAALRAEIKAYRDAVDAQPWATDEPIRVLLDRITAALVSLRKDRERLAYVGTHFANAIHYCCRVDGDEWNTDFIGTLDRTMQRDAAQKDGRHV